MSRRIASRRARKQSTRIVPSMEGLEARVALATFLVNTEVGSQPAPPALTVSPTSITLTCGATGAVTAAGGNGSFSVNSTSSRVTANASGNTIGITLNAVDATPGPHPTTVTVSVTDGSTIVPVTVSVPATCP